MTKTTTVASKAFVAIVAAAMVFSLVAPAAKAATAEELQAQIATLMAQITALQGGTTATPAAPAMSAYTFTRALTLGSTGADVTALQNHLISKGHAIAAGATGYFGAQTAAAVAAWQTANGITPAAGYFGPVSQAKYAAMMAVTTPTTPGTGTTTDDGDDDNMSGDLQGEGVLASFETEAEEDEVGEGALEVVAIYTLEAEDGDVELDRLTFDLTPNGGAEEEDAYDAFETISLWVDGDMVAEFDASDEENYLDEDLGTFRFSSIGVVLPEDEEVEISLGVEAASSVDGAGDNATSGEWDIKITDIRSFDADGVADNDSDIEESDDVITFDIVAEGQDDDAEINSSNDDPEAATLRVEDDNSDSDEYTIFTFEIEVDEESSDLTLDDAKVTVNVANPAGGVASFNADAVIADVMMTIDGQEEKGDADAAFATAIANSTNQDVVFTFEFDGLDLEAGETYTAEVAVVFEGRNATAYDIGTKVSASVDGTTWQVEGIAGDNILTGSDSSQDHTLAEVVPVISDVTSEAKADDPNDSGTISFEFNVAADGDDDITGFDIADVISTLTSTAGTALAPTGVLSKVGGDATETAPGSGIFTIDEGDDATFAVDFTYTTTVVGNNGTYRVTLDTVLGVEVDETSSGMALSN